MLNVAFANDSVRYWVSLTNPSFESPLVEDARRAIDGKRVALSKKLYGGTLLAFGPSGESPESKEIYFDFADSEGEISRVTSVEWDVMDMNLPTT